TNAIGNGPESPASAPVVPARVPDAPTAPTVARGGGNSGGGISVAITPPPSHGSTNTRDSAAGMSSNRRPPGPHLPPPPAPAPAPADRHGHRPHQRAPLPVHGPGLERRRLRAQLAGVCASDPRGRPGRSDDPRAGPRQWHGLGELHAASGQRRRDHVVR